MSVGVLQGYSPIATSLHESFPGAVRYRLPPPLPTSGATPEKLSQPSVVPDDLSLPVARRKLLQVMGWRRVRRLRRVVWDVFLGRVRWVPLVLPDNPLAGMERTADRLCSDS